MKRKLTDLANQRTAQLEAAQTALDANDQAAYDSAMEKVQNLNEEIQRVQALIVEQDRQILSAQPSPAEARDMAEVRGAALVRGDAVNLSATEVRRAFNQVTLATGSIVEPTGAGSNIRDSLGSTVSSIVDQVYVQDLTGMGAFLEPYVITELTANGGKVETLAGKARTASADPSFGVAELRPYELNVTSYVDRNISRLSPAGYYDKVFGMAMRALRRKVAGMIVNGDGAASPTMYGIVNAKNKAGAAIYAEQSLSAVNETTLDELYFAYGSSEEMGPAARLLLTKANLKKLGALRGTNEKRRLLEITPDSGNPNTGVIRDGGMLLPFTLCGDVSDGKLLYGDPLNYELGLFGEYSIRVDESVKAVERMVAVLGDVFVGGNLIVDKGFVVGTVGGSSAG